MKHLPVVENWILQPPAKRRLLIGAGWVLVVGVFAAQWYAYDSGHGFADPFADYLGWSCYIWGVLTPLGLWIGRRCPINAATWRSAVPLHIAASLLLATVQLSLEASLEWWRAGGQWPLAEVVRHYLRQHTA